jgi:DNA-binding NarL/FixJ family response regulator
MGCDVDVCDICGEAANGREAIEKALVLRPDVILMDVCMPLMNGPAAARELRRLIPGTKIVFLSVQDAKIIGEMLPDVRADGYLSKDCSISDLQRTKADVMSICYEEPYTPCLAQFPITRSTS